MNISAALLRMLYVLVKIFEAITGEVLSQGGFTHLRINITVNKWQNKVEKIFLTRMTTFIKAQEIRLKIPEKLIICSKNA